MGSLYYIYIYIHTCIYIYNGYTCVYVYIVYTYIIEKYLGYEPLTVLTRMHTQAVWKNGYIYMCTYTYTYNYI